MKFFESMKNGTWKGALQGFGMQIGQARPEIILVMGGLSMLAGTILVGMKAEKGKNATAEMKTQVKEAEIALNTPIEQAQEAGIDLLPETKKQMKVEKGRQYTKIYGHYAYELIKIYGLAAVLWLGGFGMVVGGHAEVRKINKGLVAQLFASSQAIKEYRNRVADAVGKETEEKLYLGMKPKDGEILVREIDEKSGEEKVVKKKAGEFYAQPGSIFARNFIPENTDIKYFEHIDELLDAREREINYALDVGMVRAYNGMDILRHLGFDENALGTDEEIDALLANGISGNARKVPDPEMRKLKITRLRGYKKEWDPQMNCEVFKPCLRVDFNFYPLAGKI